MDFRFDYGTVQSSTAKNGAAPLWAAIDGRVSTLAGDEAVFFDPHTGRSHVMTQQVLQALEICRPFRPLSEHVEAVVSELPGLQGKQAAVKPVLESLQTRGLLMSDDAFLKRMRDVPLSTQAQVSGLFIRACNRPRQLAALLASLLPRAEALTAANAVVVVDDSTNADALAANAKSIGEFARQWPQPVHHVTPTIWRSVIDQICSELPEHAAALRGVLANARPNLRGSGGGGRNLTTLLAAGTRYLILDDDNLLPLHALPAGRPRLDPKPASSSVRTFADHESALAAGEVDEAALSWHLQVCGGRLGESLVEGGPIEFGHEQLHNFAPSRQPALTGSARIALTVNGHRGGSCNSTPHWLLTLDPAARAGLCASEQSYLAGRGDASVWVGFDSVFATRMATISPFAVDNSQLMPCTSPNGRSEDLVYTALVSAGDGSSLQLLAPFTAGHLPESGRDRTGQLTAPRAIGFGVCIGDMIGSVAADLHSQAPAGRFSAVAARMRDLADGSSESVQAYLREYLVYDRVNLLRKLQDALPAAQHGPDALKSDIRKQIEVNVRAVLERGVPRFSDVGANASGDECAQAFRDELCGLAGGLAAWSFAWEVALDRRAGWLDRARVPG